MTDKATHILRDKKVNPTAVRIRVLDYLLDTEKAQSLSDIEKGLIQSDRSSIFRTLKTFEENKVIHSVEDGTGMTKYAVCIEGCNCDLHDLHYHFYCERCQVTYCLLDNPIQKIDLPPKYVMQQANMVIKGICASCNH